VRVFIESILPAPPDRVWEALERPETLQRIAAPVLRFRPAQPGGLPRYWRRGTEARLRLYLFGLLPLGPHTIRVDAADPARGELRTRESGLMAPVWNHTIRIAAHGDGATRYSDEVEIRAGVRTPVVWLFAQLFYRHRQRRWRTLLRGGDRGG
jgi:ligand-binding SRPBCC domain-containing protein